MTIDISRATEVAVDLFSVVNRSLHRTIIEDIVVACRVGLVPERDNFGCAVASKLRMVEIDSGIDDANDGSFAVRTDEQGSGYSRKRFSYFFFEGKIVAADVVEESDVRAE